MQTVYHALATQAHDQNGKAQGGLSLSDSRLELTLASLRETAVSFARTLRSFPRVTPGSVVSIVTNNSVSCEAI